MGDSERIVRRFTEEEVQKIKCRIESDSKECFIRSVQFTESGGILVADRRNNNLKLFDKTGAFIISLEMPSTPYDIVVLAGKVGAISLPESNVIKFISLRGKTLTHLQEISQQRKMYLLARCGPRVLAYCGKGSSHQTIHGTYLDGRVREYMDTLPMKDVHALCCYEEESLLFVLDKENSTVAVFDSSRDRINSISLKDYANLEGMCLGPDGDLYTCASRRIIQTALDGRIKQEMHIGDYDPLGVAVDTE